ncbi:MAG: class I SAM-dependent methyltransferase [Anaerolineae bacterium]|nr:class I SAM-dependent methyltransferase [Anaerolineae bacterium]
MDRSVDEYQPGQSVEVVSTSCHSCGADDASFLFEGWDRLHGQPGRFRVVGCRQCGLIYLNPRPTPAEIGRYYPQDYRPYIAPVRAASKRVTRWDARYGLYKRLRVVSARQPGGRLLDVGCATGDFLAFAHEHGWETHGVELVESAAAYCRDILGLHVVTGDLLDAAYPDDHFDVITLWNVFEHLYAPAATLHELKRIVKPGGWLVMAVPNPDSLDAHLFGPAWAGYDVPRHLYTFPTRVLHQLLSREGFKVVDRRCVDSSHFIFFLSLRFWLMDHPAWARLVSWAQRLEQSRVVRLLTAPYFRLVDILGQGPVVTVVARQEDSA